MIITDDNIAELRVKRTAMLKGTLNLDSEWRPIRVILTDHLTVNHHWHGLLSNDGDVKFPVPCFLADEGDCPYCEKGHKRHTRHALSVLVYHDGPDKLKPNTRPLFLNRRNYDRLMGFVLQDRGVGDLSIPLMIRIDVYEQGPGVLLARDTILDLPIPDRYKPLELVPFYMPRTKVQTREILAEAERRALLKLEPDYSI